MHADQAKAKTGFVQNSAYNFCITKIFKGKKNGLMIRMYDKTTNAILVFVLTVQSDQVFLNVLFCLDLLRVKIKYSHKTTHSLVKHTLRIVQGFSSPFEHYNAFEH